MGDLPSDKRAELRARRDALRTEIELRQQRDLIAMILDPADAMGIPYELGYRDIASMAWLEPFFSWKVETYQHLTDVLHDTDLSRAEMVAWVKRVTEEKKIGDRCVVFASDNMYQPTVRIILADFVRLPIDALAWAFAGHNWIMHEPERWVFEFHHFSIWWGCLPDSPPRE